ncbi:MAG: alpha/beta hydrolase [bacterium]
MRLAAMVLALCLGEMGAGEDKSEIFLTSFDGTEIAVDLYSGGFESVVILVPGHSGRKDMIELKALIDALRRDFDVIAMDNRGHGRSGGWFTHGLVEHRDLEEVVKYARQRYERVGIVGFSLGGMAAILEVGRLKNADSVVTVSAPMDFREIDYHILSWEALSDFPRGIWHLLRLPRLNPWTVLDDSKLRPIDYIEKVSPILIIHGTRDWVVEERHAEALYRKAKEPKKLIIVEGGGHAEKMLLQFPDTLTREISLWFKETL